MTSILTVAPTAGFGFNLFRQEVVKNPGKNVLVAPISVSAALGMALNGARGTTRAGMIKALDLRFDDNNPLYQALFDMLSQDLGVTLKIANAIWAHKGESIVPEFLEKAKKYFDARVESADFADPKTVTSINGWVDEKTKGLIKAIIKELGPLDIMLLLNATYFKGSWKNKFDKSDTKDETFFAAGGEKKHPLMFQTLHTPVINHTDWSAVALPFGPKTDRVNFFAILPRGEKTVSDIVNGLDEQSLTKLIQESWAREVDLYLPKFKIDYDVTLNDSLAALGMGEALKAGADFSGLRSGSYISEVVHKTVAAFDEEGGEAAAVTAVRMTLECVAPPPLKFRVDRPFVFLLADKQSGALLFAGLVNDPK